MITLRIQHSVPTFESWKRAFDADPLDRKSGGVRRCVVHRSVSDPNLVMIDLDFESAVEAEAFLGKLRALWTGAGQAVMRNPNAWLRRSCSTVRPLQSPPGFRAVPLVRWPPSLRWRAISVAFSPAAARSKICTTIFDSSE